MGELVYYFVPTYISIYSVNRCFVLSFGVRWDDEVESEHAMG